MNSSELPDGDIDISTNETPVPPLRRNSVWRALLRVLAGNPFYPVSAGLLLLGIHQLSVDPNFLGGETPKLLFNFGALQLYELLLVGVAVLLARRRVHYDSTLLVAIENLLVLVPFILLTQAVLIGRPLAFGLCVAGGLLVVVRFGYLRWCLPQLPLPPRLLMAGVVVLLANLALPFVYRPLMEQDVADWEQPSHIGWLLVLPGLQALALLWSPTGRPNVPTPQRGWLPMLAFQLWIAGSAVHLWCVGYVSDLVLKPYLLAPLLWVAVWCLYGQVTALVPGKWLEPARRAWLVLAAACPLAGWSAETSLPFIALSLGNVLLFLLRYVRGRDRWALHLVVASVFALLAGLPTPLLVQVLPSPSRFLAVELSVLAYALTRILMSCRWEMAIVGALLAIPLPSLVLGDPVGHLGIHVALVYLLLHELRRASHPEQEAPRLRALAALAWGAHAQLWMLSPAPLAAWVVGGSGLLVVAGWGAARILTGIWPHWTLPAAATFVMLSGPISRALQVVGTSPRGLHVLGASFVMLGAGTWLALNKHRWWSERP